jgi:hypothetical protein
MPSSLLIAVFVIWMATAQSTARGTTELSAQDTAVLTAVLSHFSVSRESAQYNPHGYIGVAPVTKVVMANWSVNDFLEYLPRLDPPAPDSTVENYVSRNRHTYSVGPFPLLGASVHVDRTERTFELLLDRNGDLRTYVYLRVPGYSADGIWAYVSFEYLWSMHPAFATYLVKRVEGRWVVVSTDFSYAV